jgi:Domain of unknown function (DUF4167)
MRPGQNKRMRGRPTNNRRGPNPLTRSYESNGPDVKIRGNAHHVAEKYLQLARDAHTGGDPVAAENYLQHAEHYFRLIAAAQAAQALALSGQPRPAGEGDGDELEDDSDFGTLSDRFASPSERAGASYQQPQQGFQTQPSMAPNAPQSYPDRAPYEGERQGPGDRGGFANRQDRQGNRFPDRVPRADRPFAERTEGYRDNRHNRDGRPRDFRPYRDSPSQPSREGGADAVASPALPPFITESPRPNNNNAETTMAEPSPDAIASPTPNETTEASPPVFESPSGDSAFPPRVRRRRLRSPYGFGRGGSGESGGPNSTPEVTDDPPVSE